ncbi:MAG: hypothetical protein CME06_13830 [Gemmatimonadetes bacterium]|nr:hypothetical protein [Gemmatimonadota bacterium]
MRSPLVEDLTLISKRQLAERTLDMDLPGRYRGQEELGVGRFEERDRRLFAAPRSRPTPPRARFACRSPPVRRAAS